MELLVLKGFYSPETARQIDEYDEYWVLPQFAFTPNSRVI